MLRASLLGARCLPYHRCSSKSIHQAGLWRAPSSGEVSDSSCSRPAAAMLDARARMLAAQILLCAKSLTLRCSVLSLQKMSAARVQHSASGNATKTGEVSDSACSRPAAASFDARARTLAWSMHIIMASVVKVTSGGILTTCLLEDTLLFCL